MFGFRRSIVRIRSYTLPWRSLYGLLVAASAENLALRIIFV